jgi:4-hydroxy-3-methylbut-2-en-1-yl diphosphate reductase
MQPVPEQRRRVLLAAPRGFCAGVVRAVAVVEEALDRFGAPVHVRRHIVHNSHVVTALERRGAVFVEDVEDVPDGSIVIFSAHGVATEVRDRAATRDLRTIDATCPLVHKVHQEARRFADEGYEILLIGASGHDEVVGTLGVAPDRIQVVDGPAAVSTVEVRDPRRVAWLSQTTLAVDEVMATVTLLRERFPHLRDPPSEDVCYAAQNRQAAVKRIAGQVDLMLIVGSAHSHNSSRLVQVALDGGAAAAHLIENADGIAEEWLDAVSTVGLSAGASAPESLVQGVLDWLGPRGYHDIEEVETAREGQTFALPLELRRPAGAGRDQHV